MKNAGRKKGTLSIFTDSAYDIILSLLRQEFNVPVKERTREHKSAIIRFTRKRADYALGEDGQTILFCGKEVVRKSLLEDVVRKGLETSESSSVRKLQNEIRKSYSGISERSIYKVLHSAHLIDKRKKSEKRTTKQVGKQVPISIEARVKYEAKYVQECHQIIIVDMTSYGSDQQGSTYQYVLSATDVFSLYTWLRPLNNNGSQNIIKELMDIYREHGVPEILQHNNGEELDIELKKLPFIQIQPYPQAELDEEFESKLCQIVDIGKSGDDWVKQLPKYAETLNNDANITDVHVPAQTPFQKYYGRKRNNGNFHDNDGSEENDVENEIKMVDICSLADHDERLDYFTKMGFAVHFNPQPDGNCQFSALADQLERVGIVHSTQSIRADVTKYIQQHPYNHGNTHLENFVQGSFKDYIKSMGNEGTFGDHLTLQAASNVYKVNIVIFSTLGPQATQLISPREPTNSSSLVLGHIAENDGLHYVSLSNSVGEMTSRM